MRKTQLFLFDDKIQKEHGGDLSIGKRKGPRPFSRRKPIHLTLRATQASGNWRLTRHERFIKGLCQKLARKWSIRIYSLSVNSNHCHLLLKASDRRGFQNFLRVFSGHIAIRITGAVKGSALKKRFFDRLAWTRILEWGRPFEILKRYVLQNRLEDQGLIVYTPRKRRYRQNTLLTSS